MEKICKTSDVPKGSMNGFPTAKDGQVLIANVNGKFYAMDAVCSHRQGALAKGKLEKNIVTCPVHGAQFDVTTGKVVKNVPEVIKLFTLKEANDLKTFKVSVKDGFVYVDV